MRRGAPVKGGVRVRSGVCVYVCVRRVRVCGGVRVRRGRIWRVRVLVCEGRGVRSHTCEGSCIHECMHVRGGACGSVSVLEGEGQGREEMEEPERVNLELREDWRWTRGEGREGVERGGAPEHLGGRRTDRTAGRGGGSAGRGAGEKAASGRRTHTYGEGF